MDWNRRRFIGGAAAFAVISPAAAKGEEAYWFRTPHAEIEMRINFHDGYVSQGFWFGERKSKRKFCLSSIGEEGRNCLAGFSGSLAITRYRVRPRSRSAVEAILREHVRTIDHHAELPDREPFDRSIVLKQGIGSDLQAFGYEGTHRDEPLFRRHGAWYLFRQDLFLEPQRTPLLSLYWKHTLASIRVLDIIPGDQTWLDKK